MSSKRSVILFGLSLIIGLAFGQVPQPGKCPDNIKAMENFDGLKYLGKWYEYGKYPFLFEVGGKCIFSVYDVGSVNGTVSVLSTQVNTITGKGTIIRGIAKLTDEPGKMVVNFEGIPSIVGDTNYWVIGTDYTKYAVVYSCGEYLRSKLHTTIVWVLTRDRVPSNETIAEAHKVIDANKIPKTYLKITNQSGCPEIE